MSSNARIIALVALILIGGGALAYAIIGKKPTPIPPVTSENTNTQATTSTSTVVSKPVTSTPTPTPTPTPSSTYKDGTYAAIGSYFSPGGNEHIGVSLTLKNDIITSASVTPEPTSSQGLQFQAIFAANFKPLVIGKDISTVHLTQVSGSSLTSQGFNDALAQIEAQAKS